MTRGEGRPDEAQEDHQQRGYEVLPGVGGWRVWHDGVVVSPLFGDYFRAQEFRLAMEELAPPRP